jgi:magnesium-transporting ATPase (P-type)
MIRGKKVEDLVSTGVGLAVAAVPEGLPVLATAAQLSASERLSLRGALVKNPRAIEAVGRIDLLCMDKTGTLTEGRIQLTTIHTGDHSEPIDELSEAGRRVLSSAARAVVREEGVSIDPLDTAIDRAVEGRLPAASDDGETLLAERAFESARGFEAVLVKESETARMFVKGTPELIIDKAESALIKGEVHPMDSVKAQLQENVEHLTFQGLRVIAVAEREIGEAELVSADPGALLEDPQEVTFLGLIAFRDPVRPTAASAIRRLARAGVQVAMVTGDHPGTAERVAREVNMMGQGGVLKGSQIAEMTDEALDGAVQDTNVFARVTPAQKVRVIRALQRRGRVVGMVGDGANDAAAMRAADAGIAVGLGSTDAARDAADIVLREARIDELFETVVEGRAMWHSVRNAVSILIGGNLGEIAFSVAVGALTGRPPLSPRQLLVVNFLTDIAPSTAIALKPPGIKDLHSLRKAGPKEALGSPLNREIITRAITTSIGAWSAWSMARFTGSRDRASTVGLLGLVGSQLGQTLLAGGKSRSVILTGLGSVLVMGVLVQTPGLSRALGCTPLGPVAWSTALSASLGSTLISPVVQAIVDRVADRLGPSASSSRITAATQRLLGIAKDLLVI